MAITAKCQLLLFCLFLASPNLLLANSYYLTADNLASRQESYQLVAATTSNTRTAPPAREVQRERAGEGIDWHKYLGYSTVGLAFATGPANSQKSLHYGLAYSAAASAVATVVTGFLQHGSELRGDSGFFGPINRHALLGGLGALAMVTGVAVADSGDNSGHSAIAIGGSSAMLLSIIDMRW